MASTRAADPWYGLYPDADFAGMYGHEEHTDPACAKSRTGFIIIFADCTVFWTALLTMEA
jgi:hypothetical protein